MDEFSFRLVKMNNTILLLRAQGGHFVNECHLLLEEFVDVFDHEVQSHVWGGCYLHHVLCKITTYHATVLAGLAPESLVIVLYGQFAFTSFNFDTIIYHDGRIANTTDF